MGMEISVNTVLVEQDDGAYKALCPDIGIEARGKNADEAVRAMKEAVIKHIKDIGGASNLRLNAVKCMKLKIQVG